MQINTPRLQVVTVLLCCCGCLLFGLTGRGQPAKEEAAETALDIQADNYEFQPQTGLAVGRGNVRITYEDLSLTADHVEVNTKTNDVAGRGNIVFQRGVFRWRGPSISGNIETKEFNFGSYEATSGVFYAKGEGGVHRSDGQVALGRTQLSTCEYFDHPHYSIKARRAVHFPDGRFRAYHTVYKVGKVPIFYWPVVFGDTDGVAGNVEIKPGYDSDWGPYLLLGREWPVGTNVATKMMLHLRGKNGVALGNRTRAHTSKSDTDFVVYGMRDEDPPETEEGYNRRFNVQDDRYRVKLYHRQALAEGLSLRVRGDAFSDIDMLEDWFRREHRRNPQPKSFADLTYESERFTLSLAVRPRVNDFFSVVETLPELRVDFPRQPVGGTPLYYQGESSAAHLEMRWREFDKSRQAGLTDPEDYESWRLDSLHMLYLPFRILDALQVTPRAGGRITYYDKSSDTPLGLDDFSAVFDVDDPDNPNSLTPIQEYDHDGGDKLRLAGEVGLELKSKFYAAWPESRSRFWDTDGLRHIVEPYANYTFAPKPSERRDRLFFFDELDRLLQQHFVRVGVDQRWQTKRRKEIYTLVRMENYADFHFAKEDEHHHLGNLGSRIEFSPKPTLDLWGKAVVDMGEPDLNRAEVGVALGDPERHRLGIGYVYRNSYVSRAAYSMGSSLCDFSGENYLLTRRFDRSHYATADLALVLNEKTSGLIRYEYDFVERELARQVYEITRDLHCWVGALRVEEDNGDLRVVVLLYLKAFPKVRIDTSI